MITISADTCKELISDRIGFAVSLGWIDEYQAEAYEQFILEGITDDTTIEDFDPKNMVDNMIINDYKAVSEDEIKDNVFKNANIVASIYTEGGLYYIIDRRSY